MQTTRAVFSVVATPIGNLEDITLRAIRVLKEADLVLCEDTRVTRNLFQKYGISSPTMSYHARSKLAKVDMILDMLASNIQDEKIARKENKNPSCKKIAMVSDAGTPGISDPGALLVSKIRKRFAAEIASGEIKVEAVPGPSALAATVSVAGIPCADFVFLGFLPHKKGRETLFREMAAAGARTTVFYESPHRIEKTLESLAGHMPEKTVAVGRELTKLFEEVVSGTPSELVRFFKGNPDKVRGEFVVIVSQK